MIEVGVDLEKLGHWEIDLKKRRALLEEDKANWEAEKAQLIKQIHAEEQKKSVEFPAENPQMKLQFLATQLNEATHQYNAYISALNNADRKELKDNGYTISMMDPPLSYNEQEWIVRYCHHCCIDQRK